MGRWDESIYGGDDSLKHKENIYEICKAEEYGDDNKVQPIPVKILKKKIVAIRKAIDKSKEGDDFKNIGYQVLGAIVMHAGFDMEENDGLKKRILKSIEKDDWAKERPLRKIVLTNFKKLINEYEFSEPVDVEKINLFEEGEEEADEDIAKEFKEVFGLMNSRIKKLESSIEEKSGVKEYDEGYAAAAEEEIEFLTDFKELVSKQELMGVLLEKISKGLVGNSTSETTEAKVTESSGVMSNKSVDAGRADVQPG